MKILMIAPEPFFQPRGTPFSEYYRIRCLSELGHEVDLVTYHIGEDVEIPGLRIFRAPRVPGVNDVRIGPSFEKLPLDAALFFAAWRRLAAERYDAIHSHEEGGLMAVLLARMYGLPHVYDMHSSLPDQLATFEFTRSRMIRGAFDWLEKTVLKNSDAVIAICPSLVDKALSIEPRARVTLIENVAESCAVDDAPPDAVRELRRELKLGDKRIVLYVGTFEVYQGLGLLLETAERLFRERDDCVLLLVGGRANQVEAARAQARELGIEDRCRFTGRVAHERVPGFLKLADVLVSPRCSGANTPLKIYSYMRSGAPIVATNLYTHTQALSGDVAVLVEPDAASFAAGVAALLDDLALGKRLAAAAFRLSEEKYSYRVYAERTRAVYDQIAAINHG